MKMHNLANNQATKMAQHTQETFKWGNLGCINVEPHNSLITQIATHKNYLVQTKAA
jgi:hypothetical protein